MDIYSFTQFAVFEICFYYYTVQGKLFWFSMYFFNKKCPILYLVSHFFFRIESVEGYSNVKIINAVDLNHPLYKRLIFTVIISISLKMIPLLLNIS